jgi:hypothetical protein
VLRECRRGDLVRRCGRIRKTEGVSQMSPETKLSSKSGHPLETQTDELNEDQLDKVDGGAAKLSPAPPAPIPIPVPYPNYP